MPKSQLRFLVVVTVLLLMLAFSFPAEAKKSKKSKKAKAAIAETIPADLPTELPPPDEEALPSNTKTEAPEAPAAVAAAEPAELPPPAPLDEPPPEMDDTREPAQQGPAPKQAAADDQPPTEDLVPPENMPEAKGEEITEAERQAVEKAAAQEQAEQIAAEKLVREQVEQKAAEENEVELKAAQEKAAHDKKLAEEKAAEELPPPPLAEEVTPRTRKGRAKGRQPRKPAEEDGSLSTSSPREYVWQSPRYFGLDLQYSPVQYQSLALDGAGSLATKVGTGIRLGFEWMFLQEFGKLSVGLGLLYSNLPEAADSTGAGKTVTAFGGEATATYRADFVEHQILVPFGRIGTDVVYALQNYTDGRVASQGSYRGMMYGGGIELCLFIFEKKTARLLDRNFGINETYLVFEYLKTQNTKLGVQPDLSHDEFRFGLRFEI